MLFQKAGWRNGTPYLDNYDLEYGQWTIDDFPNLSEKVFTRAQISSYVWIKNHDYYLSSDINGDDSSDLLFTLERCNNSSSNVTCKSDEEIDQIVNSHYLNIVTISAYFDFDDYVTPIKTFMNDFDVFSLSNDFGSYYELKIKQNKAILIDDFIATSTYKSLTYYSTGTPVYRTLNSENSNLLFRIYI